MKLVLNVVYNLKLLQKFNIRVDLGNNRAVLAIGVFEYGQLFNATSNESFRPYCAILLPPVVHGRSLHCEKGFAWLGVYE